ncbi:MAG: AMP-binding protein [Brevirhabdus sp.]
MRPDPNLDHKSANAVIVAIRQGLRLDDAPRRSREKAKYNPVNQFHDRRILSILSAHGHLIKQYGLPSEQDVAEALHEFSRKIPLTKAARHDLCTSARSANASLLRQRQNILRRMKALLTSSNPSEIIYAARVARQMSLSELDGPIARRIAELNLDIRPKTSGVSKTDTSPNDTDEPGLHAEILDRLALFLTGNLPQVLATDLDQIRAMPGLANKAARLVMFTAPKDLATPLFEVLSKGRAARLIASLGKWRDLPAPVLSAVIRKAHRERVPPRLCAALVQQVEGRLMTPAPQDREFQVFSDLVRVGAPDEIGATAIFRQQVEQSGLKLCDGAFEPHTAAIRGQPFFSVPPNPAEIKDLVTPRGTKTLEMMSEAETGVVAFSVHNQKIGPAGYRLALALATTGQPVLSYSKGANALNNNRIGTFVEASRDRGLDWQLLSRRTNSPGKTSREALAHLDAGGAINIAFDLVTLPGRKALAPWFLGPIEVPTFAANLALARDSFPVLAQSWLDDSGRQVIDFVPIERPPEIGHAGVRASWLTQRAARAARRMAFDDGMKLDQNSLRRRHRPPSARVMQPLAEWISDPRRSPGILAWIGRKHGDLTALFHSEGRTSFDELEQLVLRMASLVLFFQSGDEGRTSGTLSFAQQHRVLTIFPPGLAFMASQAGALAAGSMAACLQDDLSGEVLAQRIRTFEPDLILCGAESWARVLGSAPDLENRPVLLCDDTGGQSALDELLDGFDPATALPRYDPDRPGAVIFTSGSTGTPKGVVQRLGIHADNGGIAHFMEMRPGDRLLYHGRWESICGMDILASLGEGVSNVVPPRSLVSDPVAFIRFLTDHRVNWFTATSSLISSMCQYSEFNARNLADLQGVMPWGEKLRVSLVSALQTRFPKALLGATYGSSEYSFTAFGALDIDRMTTITGSPGGFLVPGVKTVGQDGTPPESGAICRMQATGSNRSLGYFDALLSGAPPADRSDPLLLDDWVRVSDDGFADILGRVDSIVKIRGRRVSLAEIEHAVEQSKSVKRAYAFIEETGQSQATFLALETADGEVLDLVELRQLIETHLFAGAFPQRVEAFDRFPLLKSGKIDRKAISAVFTNPKAAEPASAARRDTVQALSPLMTEFSAFAARNGMVALGAFDPSAELPSMDSINVLDLMLIVEKATGTLPSADVFQNDDTSRSTWAELEQAVLAG